MPKPQNPKPNRVGVTFLVLSAMLALGAALAMFPVARAPAPGAGARQELAQVRTGAASADASRIAPRPIRPRGEAFQEKLSAKMDALREELRLIQELRRLQFTDPEYAVRLAENFAERFPDSAQLPERAWYQARNLVYLARFDEARHIAEDMVDRHPESPWSRDLRRHLLSHPLGLPPRNH